MRHALVTGAAPLNAFVGGPRKRAAVTTFVATLCNTALVIVQGVILVPLYVTNVGPVLYGAWLASGDALVWLQAFDLGLPNVMIQRIGAASGRNDRLATSEYFWAGTAMLTAFAAGVFVIGAPVAAWAASFLATDPAEARHLATALVVAVAAAALNIANNGVVALARGDQDTTLQSAGTLVGGLIGFLVTLTLLRLDYGLLSISLGMMARMGVLLTVSATGVFRSVRRGRILWQRPGTARMGELLRLTPATAFGGLGYAVTTQSDAILVAFVLGTAAVPVLALTRKAADIMRGILDTFSYSTYAGFAHLYSSPEQHRAGAIASTVADSRIVLATVVACGYVMANEAWLRVWVGAEYSAGPVVTALLACQLIVAGQSYLFNSYLRATGQIARSSTLLVLEAITKVAGSLVLLHFAGLIGLTAGNIAVSLTFMFITGRALRIQLAGALSFVNTTRGVAIIGSLGASCIAAYALRDWSPNQAMLAAAFLALVVGLVFRLDLTVRRLAGLTPPAVAGVQVATV